jgi:hypothetical protein
MVYRDSWDSVVGIATDYGMNDRVGSKIVFFHVVQTGSGAHPYSYPMDTGGCISGDKVDGA